MKANAVVVDAAAVEAVIGEARAAVASCGLPDLLARADSGGFGSTPLNLKLLEAVAQAYAAASAAARVCAPGTPGAYLAFVFAEEAAGRLAALGPVEAPRPAAALPVAQYADMKALEPRPAVDAALRDSASFHRFYKPQGDGESLRCLYSYFRLLSRAAAALVAADPPVEVKTPTLRARGLTVYRSEESSELLPITFEDLVGNEDFVKAGRRLAQDVAGFDPKAGANPKKVRNQILFVLGSPGCGKTATAHAIGRYFLDLCGKGGLSARFRVIRRTDWASAYQNASAKTLLDIFQNEVFDAPGVCGVYWPDIDTAFAARSDADIRQEEKNILGTLFGILDGTIGPKNGKWFLICDANTVNMDDAALSRISQNPIRAFGPQTPEQYVKLLRDIKLKGKGPWLPLSDADWAGVGAVCASAKLSGRAVDNLSGRVLTEIEDFEQPEEYYALPFEEKKKLIEKLSRQVPADRIKKMIDDYCRFEREAQEKAEGERFLDRVREIRMNLTAQRAAIEHG